MSDSDRLDGTKPANVNQDEDESSSVVVKQPQAGGGDAPVTGKYKEEIRDWLILSIIVTLCVCPCAGIAAIVFSLDCRSARAQGDKKKAKYYSRKAKKVNLITIGVIVGLCVLSGIIICPSPIKF